MAQNPEQPNLGNVPSNEPSLSLAMSQNLPPPPEDLVAEVNAQEPQPVQPIVPLIEPQVLNPDQLVVEPIADLGLFGDDQPAPYFGDDPINEDGGENPNQPLTEEQQYQQNVRKNWRNYTNDELAEAYLNPLGAQELLKVVAQMNEIHLKAICPLMTEEHINRVVPQLQLQNQGMLVQEFSSEQIKMCVNAIPTGDRQLLLQNITLITQSELRASRNEEIQSIIGFIDPLAMAVAIERPELAPKVIAAASIMTSEQIRVIIPLMNAEQIRLTIETIESDENHNMAVMMVTSQQKQDVITQLKGELPELTDKIEKVIEPQITSLTQEGLPELTILVEQFVNLKEVTATTEAEFKVLGEKATKIKQSIESLQRDVRQQCIKLKVPQKLLNPGGEEKELLVEFEAKAEALSKQGKKLHELFSLLDKGNLKDGLLHDLNSKHAAIVDQITALRTSDQRPQELDSQESTDEENIFMDCDLSVMLYEAVKVIGNPQTIGDIYKISWNDIVMYGFRTADDFKKQNVTSLAELEAYINNKKNPTQATQPTSTEPQANIEPQPQPAQPQPAQ